MKKLFILFVLLTGLAFTTKAQKYFVYDGKVFSIMFKCNNANTEVLDVQFSSKDKTTGEWKWSKFDVYDYVDFESTSVPGFIFYVKDGVGNKYAVDYFRDENYVTVHALKSDGSYGTEWECTLRP
ncbi:MAG: hypothetical protein K0R65_1016 [Crocinitomicaceae bacterium]|jgi:hypothetical protein|nr:hypothetical protein [Crocinitomicaceae bacterium]